jgi:hypothetical protein
MGIEALDLTATANMMIVMIGFLPHMFAAVLLLFFGVLLANFIAEAALIGTVNAQIQEARLMPTSFDGACSASRRRWC